MEPLVSSPKLLCVTPQLESTSISPSPEAISNLPPLTENVESSPLPRASSSSEQTPDQRITKLERELGISQARCTLLQRNLSDAHRCCRESEQLLLRLQWDPKDDFYVFRNPTKSGSADVKYLDQQELKVKTLLEQMRLFQRVNEELKSEVETLTTKLADMEAERALTWQNSTRVMAPVAARDTPSPIITSPSSKKLRLKSPLAANKASASPHWMRSPGSSPADSPAMPSQSPRFWLWRKLTPTSSPASMFWRGNLTRQNSSMDPLSLSDSGIPAARSPAPNHGRRNAPEVEIGMPDSSPALPKHNISSPAISFNSSRRASTLQPAA